MPAKYHGVTGVKWCEMNPCPRSCNQPYPIFFSWIRGLPCGSCGSFCNKCMPFFFETKVENLNQKKLGSTLKIAQAPKRKGSTSLSTIHFSGAKYVSFREGTCNFASRMPGMMVDQLFFVASPKKWPRRFKAHQKESIPQVEKEKVFSKPPNVNFPGCRGLFFFLPFSRGHMILRETQFLATIRKKRPHYTTWAPTS